MGDILLASILSHRRQDSCSDGCSEVDCYLTILISSGRWITKMPPGNHKFRAVDRHVINVLHNNIKKNHLTQWFITGGRHPVELYGVQEGFTEV